MVIPDRLNQLRIAKKLLKKIYEAIEARPRTSVYDETGERERKAPQIIKLAQASDEHILCIEKENEPEKRSNKDSPSLSHAESSRVTTYTSQNSIEQPIAYCGDKGIVCHEKEAQSIDNTIKNNTIESTAALDRTQIIFHISTRLLCTV